MLSEERYAKILEMIKNRSFVRVSELMEAFGVSVETVRRDLFFLESRGLLKRVHGGAARAEQLSEFKDLSHRVHLRSELKKRLAGTAASLIRENDIIGIDTGSTAIEFAEAIAKRVSSLTVVTCSLPVFEILRGNPGFNLILVGGQYHKSEDTFYGPLAENQLKSLRVSKSFVFPSGISLKYGVTDYITELIPLQQIFLDIAQRPVIMADSSKFETTAFVKICDVKKGHIYITDDSLSDDVYARYVKNSVNLFRGEKIDE